MSSGAASFPAEAAAGRRGDDVLSLEDVALRRGRHDVVRDLRLSLAPGEMLGVIGPNGAGKTTFLDAITAEVPYAGSLRVFGREVARLRADERSAFRSRIGLVPQTGDHAPAVPLTVEEVVAIGRAARSGLMRRLSAADHAICRHWIERLGLSGLARRRFSRLSGGERRKVHLARSLAQEPDLLLLDEPAGHLDLRWQEEMTELIARLRPETGLTVVMVTHEVRHLPAGCDRLVLLGEGRMLAWGTADEVLRADLLSRAFGVPLEVIRRDGRFHVLPSRGPRP